MAEQAKKCDDCGQIYDHSFAECPYCKGGETDASGDDLSIRYERVSGDKTVQGDEVKGNKIIHEDKSDRATKIGEKCPVCRKVATINYFDCQRCGRDFICEKHRQEPPDFHDEHDYLCLTCYEVIALFHDGEQSIKAREWDKAFMLLQKAIRKGTKSNDPLLDEINDTLQFVENEQQKAKAMHQAGLADDESRFKRGEFRDGDVISKRYLVKKHLGEGGMGRVYLVEDQFLDNKEFALKFLKPEIAAAPGGLDRLKKEAVRMGELSHPHILHLWDFIFDGTLAYLKMEYAPGGTLESRMIEHCIEENPYTVEEVLDGLPGICQALDFAHSKGIIHRDMKPGNILFAADDTVKIMDFGIATVLKSTLSKVSVQPITAGTLLYMSPEQLINPRKVGPASDLYSLGCIVYEALNGYPVFPAEAAHRMHVESMPSPIEGIPDKVNDVILKCLAKEPGDRFSSAMEFFKALAEAVHAPLYPPCPVCGEALDRERFKCTRCEKENICVDHRTEEEYCPQCGEIIIKERIEKEKEQKQKAEAERKRKKIAELTSEGDECFEKEGWKRAKELYQRAMDEGGNENELQSKIEECERELSKPAKRIKGPLPGMEFVLIPGGSFMMGAPEDEEGSDDDERPQHKVTLKPFYMQVTPMTQTQWETVMGKNPSKFKGYDRPVERVSWDMAKDFFEKLNQLHPGNGFRLPSEAEWEYACRAGTTTCYYSGDSEADLNRVGWFNRNSKNKTHHVCELEANTWGLYDMHGNVGEWCEDKWHDDYKGAPDDGSAWVAGSSNYRVLRGGSWYDVPWSCRSANRYWSFPDYRSDSIGFRLVSASSLF